MAGIDDALAYARTHWDAFLKRYEEFLAIPSVSTLAEHGGDMLRAARWLEAELRRLGAPRVDVIQTPGHPIVYAEWLAAPGKPTVLVYGHYDVQPADPLDEWDSAPFTPTLRGENIYARGASDMKGSLLACLAAVEALSQGGPPPLNLKFLYEGEEEIGSLNLAEFMVDHKDLLRADVVASSDALICSPDQPSIPYALRGLTYYEVEVRGPRQDLHSGLFGGSIHNPAQALCELVAGMHDAAGRITLPGFYDRVRALDPAEREILARLPTTDAEWRAVTGAPALWGEEGYTTIERIGARPTLEITGIIGGFTGEGAKTVLPARALTKISMRLVPDQDSGEVREQLCAYMQQHAPDTITWEVRELQQGPPAIVQRDSPAMKAALGALTRAFGVEPLFRRDGGSVPIVGLMQRDLGMESIMLGFGLSDDRIHGPNEKQHLPTLRKGIETYVRFLAGMAETCLADA